MTEDKEIRLKLAKVVGIAEYIVNQKPTYEELDLNDLWEMKVIISRLLDIAMKEQTYEKG